MEKKTAVCILLVKNNEFLSVSLKEDHSDLNLPGGKVENKESYIGCAIREMKEETGLIIFPPDLKYLHGAQDGDYFVITLFTNNYEGQIDTEENHIVKWLPVKELKNSKKWPKYNTEIFEIYKKYEKIYNK